MIHSAPSDRLQRSALLRRLMDALGRALTTPRSIRHEVVFSTLAIIISTGLRFALDDFLPRGFPFLTFFPAVTLTLVLSSIRSGLAVGTICGLIAWHFFIAPLDRSGSATGSVLAIAFYVLIIGTNVLFVTAASWALAERTRAQERATAMAHARSLMFSELQHRISNNLSTVAALLRLQSQQVADETAKHALIASQSRIRSISLLQRRLHSPQMQSLDAADYLREVLHDVIEVAGAGDVALSFQADSLPLPHDTAVPLGLIASELVMNAIEHGAAPGAENRIAVTLAVQDKPTAGRIPAVLRIMDNGPGLPGGFDLSASDSLGLTVAQQFAVALNGDLTLTNSSSGGAVATLRFSIDRPDDEDARNSAANAPAASSQPDPAAPRHAKVPTAPSRS
ncbi:MAG: histidine kinase [Alphaproteobacteria bacterium]|nr:histidine kinase [Alphaproteobacteria bacterium]